jgi:Spx/MgsR family transcriptional regulator
MTTILYGIKNCDTVKAARQWLEANHIEYTFRDFRADGLTLQHVQSWLQEIGMDTLINKRSTTWKQLDANTRDRLNENTAAAILMANPTLIKRPVLDIGHQRTVGFNAQLYGSLFKKHTL